MSESESDLPTSDSESTLETEQTSASDHTSDGEIHEGKQGEKKLETLLSELAEIGECDYSYTLLPIIESQKSKSTVLEFVKKITSTIKTTKSLNEPLPLLISACRFELPPDYRDLKGMSVIDYISTFCSVTDRRVDLYNATYNRFCKSNSAETITSDILKDVLFEHFRIPISVELMDYFNNLVGLTSDKVLDIDNRRFTILAAIMERVLALDPAGAEYVLHSDFIPDLEAADYSALERKLRGVDILPELNQFFQFVLSTCDKTA